ncbi:MAG: site-specific recombinase [Gammaproteobacteria bacterium]|nr:site-specific recombinase [Gammaproteobacteria bacterium]
MPSISKKSNPILQEAISTVSPETFNAALSTCYAEMLTQTDSSSPSAQPFIDLIEQLRPSSSYNTSEIAERFDLWMNDFDSQPAHATCLTNYVLNLLETYSPAYFYSDQGILSNDGFFTTLAQRLTWRILPPLQAEDRISALFQIVFYKSSDIRWLKHIQPKQWHRLSNTLSTTQPKPPLIQSSQNHIFNALMILSYRVAAMGLERDLMRIDPSIDEFESPFMAQNREVIAFIESYQPFYLDDNPSVSERTPPDERPITVMIEQCRDIVCRVRKNTRRYGVSIHLTNLMIRIEQSLARMELLLELLLGFQRSPYLKLSMIEAHNQTILHKNAAAYPDNPIQRTLQILADDQKNHASIRDLVSTNTELMALQVTENASKTGDHYVTDNRRGYFAMMRSAMGAGAIIAVMATIKVLFGRLTLAPFVKALFNSMNYSFGFMLIHMLHFTVATKQPAMTAATIAATVHHAEKTKKNQNDQLTDLARLTVNIMRTQLVAILGNIMIAMPIGLLITYLWQTFFHQSLLSHDAAHSLLHSLNPFTSLAIPHAAIAGVCLFLSGLITGYYDNLSVYHQVGARLRQHPRLIKIMSAKRLDQVSRYIENNLGALAGNFWFGIMLGSMGTLGYILGLPLDIRHIAFASVNFAQSMYALGSSANMGIAAISFLGVLLIGMTNLLVSFSLALFVALKARGVSYGEWISLGKLIIGHFFTRPTDFFLPPLKTNLDENTLIKKKPAKSS